MSTHNAPGFVSGLKAYWDNPLYSDLTLVCGNESFKVHRMLLHEQSPVFRKMLSGGFVESVTNQKTITIQDDPTAFRALLKYLYTTQYDDSARGDVSPPVFAVSMYAIADKYDFDPLRKVAARKLDGCCDPKHNSNDFIQAIYAIDSNTAPNDNGLWNVVIPKIKANIATLSTSPEFPRMATVDVPDLSVVLFQSLDKSTTPVFRSTPFEQPPSSEPRGLPVLSDDEDSELDNLHDLQPYQAPGKKRGGVFRGRGRRIGDI